MAGDKPIGSGTATTQIIVNLPGWRLSFIVIGGIRFSADACENPMVGERTAREIQSRFHEEQDYIERYIRFLSVKSIIHDHQVKELNRVLGQVHIRPLPTRGHERTAQPYSQEEAATLLAAIQVIDPEVYQTILGHEQRLDYIPNFDLDGPAAGHLHLLNEWIDYVMDLLPYDPEERDEDAILRGAMHHYYETADLDLDEEDRIPSDALRALISTAIEHAKHIQIRRQLDAMIYAREQFANFELFARAARPDAEVNVLRQGFLLLMTAFDAAAFDLTRVALQKNFFRLIGVFGKHDKVSLEDIGEAGSFDTFRDQMIEGQLKKRYIKDLLIQLQALGVALVDEHRGDRQVQLIELIMRRNVHVHNRGRIDERYLEADPQSKKPKYNLYNLKPGDIAYIDANYLEMGNRLCANCIDRLANWVASAV